jgi:ATP-dependent RNA helicase RhlE
VAAEEHELLRAIERLTGAPLPRQEVPGFEPKVLSAPPLDLSGGRGRSRPSAGGRPGAGRSAGARPDGALRGRRSEGRADRRGGEGRGGEGRSGRGGGGGRGGRAG